MLADKDIEKLCRGRIVYAPVYNSFGTDAAGPHNCVILSTNAEIAAKDEYTVAVITTKSYNLELVPVPSRTGLKGNIDCAYIQRIALPGIISISPHVLHDAEMIMIMNQIRAAQARRRSTQA